MALVLVFFTYDDVSRHPRQSASGNARQFPKRAGIRKFITDGCVFGLQFVDRASGRSSR